LIENTPKDRSALELDTDVLVVGGGPAALWAALTARQHGARAVLVDKGFAGASGVAAAATAGHWWVPPEGREAAMAERDRIGGGLSDPGWMARVLEETWRRFPEVAGDLAHPSPMLRLPNLPPASRPVIEGPVYGRALRRRASRAGVRVLDHSPALELLVDDEGAVRGAAGVRRQQERTWRIVAGAVILATGGCSFRSGSLGSDVDTGDGLLMGAEVGARLSGMEFSNYYGIVPKGSSLDKNGYYGASTFTDADGEVVAVGWSGAVGAVGPHPWEASLARAGLRGPVFAILDRAPEASRPAMRAAMPNFFMALDRLGIDPFTQRFEIGFVQEGTVRGTGGLRPADETCWTGVPGLWAAGDALSRERIVGAASGAGAANAAFTIASGTWAGRAAAEHATREQAPAPPLHGAGRVGLRPAGRAGAPDEWRAITRAVQEQALPMQINALRTGPGMRRAQVALDGLWRAAGETLRGADARGTVRAREAAAMLATARWAFTAALARAESRGMHVRDDMPATNDALALRIVLDGTDEIAVSDEPIGVAA
jgi:succinate dehydrogenase/fumarate reductase flavoprotein subunit